jgi:hypothetical protein
MTTTIVQGFINSIPDKRIARAFSEIFSRITPSKLDTAITAHAGGTKSAALALKPTCSFHDVTTVATAADSILLPPAKEGEFHFVKNSAAANAMQVFGQGTDTIDSVATGTGVSQLAGDGVMYYCLVPGNWLRIGGVSATEVFSAITTATLNATTSITVTSANASALAVGRLGATTPAFSVDASTATQVAGLKVTGAATGGTVAVVATDSGADASLTINAKGAGTIGIGSVSTGAVTITPALGVSSTITGTSASASALAVGRLGATTPALNVDASTATSVTGLKVKSAAAAGGLAVSTTSSATDESLTIDAKGSGTVTINGTATGIVILPAGTTIGGSAVAALGVVTSSSANAVAVGPNGATNPVLNINAATASAVAGINITGAATGGTVAITTTDSGADAGLSIASKGAGVLSLNKPVATHTTKAAINSTATATAAEVATGYITSTSAAPTTITLPTGTDLGTALGASQGYVHELYVDNTAGSSTVTIAVAVNGILSALAAAEAGGAGLLDVANGVTGQARFTLMFSSATAYTFTRTA